MSFAIYQGAIIYETRRAVFAGMSTFEEYRIRLGASLLCMSPEEFVRQAIDAWDLRGIAARMHREREARKEDGEGHVQQLASK